MYFSISNEPVTAQTTPTILEPGDVAIIGYNAFTDNAHQVLAIVFLVDINVDTVIRITDFGWIDDPGYFLTKNISTDGVMEWKAPRHYSTGEIVQIQFDSSGNFNPFNSIGDQIFLFQGNHTSNPSLIFGININYTEWQLLANTSYTSELPTVLIDPPSNLANQYHNSALIQDPNVITTTTFDNKRKALNYITDMKNWRGDNDDFQIMPTIPLSIGPTSLELDQFTATNKNEWIFPLIICLAIIVSPFIYKIIKDKKKFLF